MNSEGVRKVRTRVPMSAGCRQGTARDKAREPAGDQTGL